MIQEKIILKLRNGNKKHGEGCSKIIFKLRNGNKKHGEGCSTSTVSATMEESPQCLSLKSI